MASIPNLFRRLEPRDARRMYSLFLAALHWAERYERVVEVCREIRRHAVASGHKEEGYFSFHEEMFALDELQDWRGYWRVLRAWEKSVYGRHRNLATCRWRGKSYQILHMYGPILYFRGEFELGCRLYEKALKPFAEGRKHWSYAFLGHVYRPVDVPARKHEVTLSHYYRALGKDLRSWPLWNRFVDGFDNRVFSKSGIRREALRADPALLERLCEWMRETSAERNTSGTTSGERDVTESANAVKKRQTETARKIRELALSPGISAADAVLRKMFPELGDVPTIAQAYRANQL